MLSFFGILFSKNLSFFENAQFSSEMLRIFLRSVFFINVQKKPVIYPLSYSKMSISVESLIELRGGKIDIKNSRTPIIFYKKELYKKERLKFPKT